MQFWPNPGSNTPQNSSCTATNLPSQKLSNFEEHGMLNAAEETMSNSWVMFFYGPLHVDMRLLADQ